MSQELFEIENGTAVCFNPPDGKFHGWLFKKYPAGELVSIRKLKKLDPFANLPTDHLFKSEVQK